MKGVRWLLGATMIMAACGGQAPSEPAAPAAAAPAAKAGYEFKPHASLADVMRSITFPASNTIFDAQSADPAAPTSQGNRETTTEKFAYLYGGWQKVELAAVALKESANLLMVPGRLCQNGNPVPMDRDDYKAGITALLEAGEAALKAAKAKNQDQVVDASGTVAEACAKCHEIYRDTDIPGPNMRPRCTPPPAGAAPAKP